jgi:bifunctional non-homologous end joining protein LigD
MRRATTEGQAVPRSTTPLDIYRAKRDFTRTGEPAGGDGKLAGGDNKLAGGGGGGRFVVQKHDARRLHFDFRLELDGVLKSWAVTRGPSLDPADKRLAVRTEDHPVEYRSFEGTIPKGEYGGGTVMLWDRGRWRPRDDPHEGLERGVLKFDLDGERLKGGFALVRLGSKARETRENWLLIKERDAHAERNADAAELWDRSVTSGRSMHDIAADMPAAGAVPGKRGRRAARRPKSKLLDAGDDKEPARRARLPGFIVPQLATRVAEAPLGKEWLHEIKYDGYRIIATVAGSRCKLFTRSGKDWTDKFEGIADALKKLNAKSLVLDGEMVVLDERGKSSFSRLQQALEGAREPFVYFVFDLLQRDGRDLRLEPLRERKKALRRLLRSPPPGIRLSDHVAGGGERVFAEACRMGLEGIVSKRADAPYVSRRTAAWLKVKCTGRDEFVIGGYRVSKNGRPFSSLLLGEYEGGALRYRGRVGTGFDDAHLQSIGAKLALLARQSMPFDEVRREITHDAHWVAPRLVAEIAYTERTADGVLRHPSFLGLREDKRATEVRMKAQLHNGARREAKPRAQVEIAGVKLTHPDKILFPAANLTKEDLASYLAAAADRMLPHIRNRPLSLVRCPDGAAAQCFFQKHRTRGMPAELRAVPLKESGGERSTYMSIQTPAGLVAAAQVGTLELHIWGSRADQIERPDRLVFDLDPDESLPFADVRRAANDIRALLGSAGLASFPLLTGGKGIHVVVPLERRHDWDDVKGFAKAFADKLAGSEPGRFVATMSKARRKGRIFIDWLRNERGATAIAPYSVRAKPHAPVAMPVSWDRLAKIERADAFTLPTARAAIENKEDPWNGYFATRQRISPAARRFFAGN